jgi:hypothetical protein
MPRGENIAADQPQNVRKGIAAANRAASMRANRKPAPKTRAGARMRAIGDFGNRDELTRLRAVRKFLAQPMVDPETASKDRPPLARAFLEVDARIVELEDERKAAAKLPKVTSIDEARSKKKSTFDAARFA